MDDRLFYYKSISLPLHDSLAFAPGMCYLQNRGIICITRRENGIFFGKSAETQRRKA